MCALTIVSPSPSPDSRNDSSWAARAARVRVKQPPDAHSVHLSFRDLRVSIDDVTTIGEALSRCSSEELLNAVMRHEAGWRLPVDTVGSRAHHMLAGRIAASLEAMRSLEDSVAALSPSCEGVVGPLFRFAPLHGGVGLEHMVETVAFSMEDAASINECLAGDMERVCTWDALRTLRCGAGSPTVPSRLSPEALRGSHALLSRMPWERVLALPLWLPRDLSEEERWTILAKVFWSMTYRGFTPSEEPWVASSSPWESVEQKGGRIESARWPMDPVMAVLDHNCWIDTLEVWAALFAAISASETRP